MAERYEEEDKRENEERMMKRNKLRDKWSKVVMKMEMKGRTKKK